jgi:hypothetical protein
MAARCRVAWVAGALLWIVLGDPAHLQAQVTVKLGVAWSGYRASHSDQRAWEGEDYRPYLGYEVGRLQEGDAHPAMRLQLGVGYELPLRRSLSVQPELHLALRGVGWEMAELYGEAYRLSVTYAQLPVLFKLRAPEGWKLRPTLLLGGFGALSLGARRTLTVRGTSDTKTLDNVRRFDYGLTFGVEAPLSIVSRTFSVEARFEWGLGNAMSQPAGYTDLFDDAGRINVVAVSVLLGWRFGS